MSGIWPCSVCGSYFCNGVHGIVPCSGCGCCPCACDSWKHYPATSTTFKWPPDRLSDDDIERIAKRVVELLRNHTTEGQ